MFLALLLVLVIVEAFHHIQQKSNRFIVAGVTDLDMELNADAILKEALSLHKSGDVLGALESYEKVVPLLPSPAASQVLSNMGAIRMARGEYPEAESLFSSAGEKDPSNKSALLNQAIVLTTKLGEHKKALGKCIKALKLDDRNIQVYHLLGNIMQELGREQEALRYFAIAEGIANEEAAVTTDGSSTATVGEWYGREWSLSSPLTSLKMGQRGSLNLSGEDKKLYNFECLSEEPLLIRLEGFVTAAETSHIIARASSKLENSFVMGSSKTDTSREGTYRSSDNAWLASDDDELQAIQRRLSNLLGLSATAFAFHSEELQVVRYETGGEFKVHHDSSQMHPRFVTCLMYLNSLEEGDGGATWFPFIGMRREGNAASSMSVQDAIARATEGEGGEQERGLLVRPTQGDVLLFFNHNVVTGALDPTAVHSSTKLQGPKEKWIANWWVESHPDLFPK